MNFLICLEVRKIVTIQLLIVDPVSIFIFNTKCHLAEKFAKSGNLNLLKSLKHYAFCVILFMKGLYYE